jgi:hypothetical protein
MKRFSILFAVAMLFGCSNEVDTLNPGGEIDIPIDPQQRFIHFDADIVIELTFGIADFCIA